MNHELWRLLAHGSSVDPVDRRLQRAGHIRIRSFVEPDVAVADLHEGKVTGRAMHRRGAGLHRLRQQSRARNASRKGPQQACPCPCHASKKIAAIDSVTRTLFLLRPVALVPSRGDILRNLVLIQPAHCSLHSSLMCFAIENCAGRELFPSASAKKLSGIKSPAFWLLVNRNAIWIAKLRMLTAWRTFPLRDPSSRYHRIRSQNGLQPRYSGEAPRRRRSKSMDTPQTITDSSSTASFEELAIPLLPSLLRQALWLTQNEAEAEDLAQEALSKALRAFSSFTPGTNFKAWIFRILRNTFLTTRTAIASTRTSFLEDSEELDAATAPDPTPEETLIQLDNAAAVQQALTELP